MSEFTEWTDGLEEALAARFPDSAHKTLEKGGTKITYVGWTDYIIRLNELVGPGGWESHVQLTDAGGKVIVVASLTVLGITKTNVGDEEEEKKGYGSPSTNAYAQALKRTCALFGLGLYLYDKDADKKPKKRPAPRGGPDIPVIPSGQYEGRALSDAAVPLSYLLRVKDDMPNGWKKLFEDEIKRRHANIKANTEDEKVAF